MKLIKIAVPLYVLIFAGTAIGQPPKTAKSSAAKPSVPKTSTVPEYRQRIDTISGELKPQIADLWQIYGKLDDLNAVIKKHAARNGGEVSVADKDEWNKLKSTLNTILQGIRNNTKRLRSVSPVPRTLKKIDTQMVNASFELDEGVDSLVAWTETPSSEMNLQLGRQIRKGITTWTSALISLHRATDPNVAAKVYADN